MKLQQRFKIGAVVFDRSTGGYRKARYGDLARAHKWTVYDDGRPLGFLFASPIEAVAQAVKLEDQHQHQTQAPYRGGL